MGFISSDCWEQPLTYKNVEVNLIPGECVGLFQYVRGLPSGKGRAAEQKCNRMQDTKVKEKTQQQQNNPTKDIRVNHKIKRRSWEHHPQQKALGNMTRVLARAMCAAQ